jgi:hypothetical protein
VYGDDSRELLAAFDANAKHTLEFMASNQVATAQKVIWEPFPDQRPARLVAAISERCRQPSRLQNQNADSED